MRKIKKQSGAQLVEFAILLPILVVVIFSAIEFGFMLYDQAVITNASREGARAGVVGVIQGSGYSGYPSCAVAWMASILPNALLKAIWLTP